MIRRYALTGFTALVALIVLMPLVWMVSVSFMAPGEAAAFPPPPRREHRGCGDHD